jgi:hypothetical protein
MKPRDLLPGGGGWVVMVVVAFILSLYDFWEITHAAGWTRGRQELGGVFLTWIAIYLSIYLSIYLYSIFQCWVECF